MRALCVLHDHVSSSGLVGARLAELGWTVDELWVVPPDRFHSPGVDCAFPDPGEYDLLVPLGAPWSAYDDVGIGSWLGPELAWLREATRQDIAVLGICFGAQALARALGGHVIASAAPEIGWVDIHSDDESAVPAGPWFQWHYDRFVLPPGAVEIARNTAAVQAYRVGRSLGVQFHPEVTASTVDGWLRNGGAAKALERGLDPDALLAQTREQEPPAQQRTQQLVDAFVQRAFPSN
jgi:GMP synthase-like glutamine amidotransferase